MHHAICTSVTVIVQYTECNQTYSAKLGIALSLSPVSLSPSDLRTSWITRGFIFCRTSLRLNATPAALRRSSTWDPSLLSSMMQTSRFSRNRCSTGILFSLFSCVRGGMSTPSFGSFTVVYPQGNGSLSVREEDQGNQAE